MLRSSQAKVIPPQYRRCAQGTKPHIRALTCRVAGHQIRDANEARWGQRMVEAQPDSLLITATPHNCPEIPTPHMQRRLSMFFRWDPESHERQFSQGTRCQFCLRRACQRYVVASPSSWSRILKEINLDWLRSYRPCPGSIDSSRRSWVGRSTKRHLDLGDETGRRLGGSPASGRPACSRDRQTTWTQRQE